MDRRSFLVAAGASLGVGTAALAQAPPARLSGRAVRGVVQAQGRPLAGVLVSDGCRVVGTGTRGEYELRLGPDSGPFVFVTTPRAYWSDRFYVPAEEAASKGSVEFVLRPIEQPDRFDFVFITDMHLENRRWGIAKFQASLREIMGLQPRPAFVWAQGDICLEGKAGKDYLECLKGLEIPVRHGAGNHEMLLAHHDPRDEYHRLFGPSYYSFDWGPVHCIVLEGNKPIPGGKDWKAVHGAVEGSELAWLKADLAAQPKGKPIIVGVHIPIVSTYPERRHQSPENAPYWEMTNHEVLTGLLARHGVRLVLQGHMHENERAVVKGVEYVESISISGTWYKGEAGMERGVDGSPRGYRVVSVDGAKITHRYQSSAESRVERQGEFVGLDRPLAPGAKAQFVFNCYDAPNGSTAQARIDRGAWQPMPAFAAINESQGLRMPHHFRLEADLRDLEPGRHTIQARIAWPDGTVVTEEQAFQVGSPPGSITR